MVATHPACHRSSPGLLPLPQRALLTGAQPDLRSLIGLALPSRASLRSELGRLRSVNLEYAGVAKHARVEIKPGLQLGQTRCGSPDVDAELLDGLIVFHLKHAFNGEALLLHCGPDFRLTFGQSQITDLIVFSGLGDLLL